MAGRRIGYLLYTQFIERFNDSLNVAMQYFKNENINSLVLDLRYNPGEVQTTAAQHLCSSIAPVNIVNTEQPLVTYQWNDKYQAYWQSRNIQSQLKVPFKANVPVKLGLNKLHILTGSGTASASELAIIGLEPYMEIITVGDTTYGKYTASITLKPEDIYESAASYKDI
jgi:carboxyl-terminal processing protease